MLEPIMFPNTSPRDFFATSSSHGGKLQAPLPEKKLTTNSGAEVPHSYDSKTKSPDLKHVIFWLKRKRQLLKNLRLLSVIQSLQ